jgi:hypothetical protein
MNKEQILQYNEWLAKQKSSRENSISKHKLKEALIKDLTIVKNMSPEEYTLYRKWMEIQKKTASSPLRKFVSDYEKKHHELPTAYIQLQDLLATSENVTISRSFARYRNTIWNPDSWRAYMKIEPKVILCRKKDDLKKFWQVMRTYTSTMVNNPSPRRNLNFIVIDKKTETLLGVFALSSDYRDLRGRDDYIGWSRDVRSKKPYVMFNHTAVASTLVPTQPFGYNYLGGKLIALMAISNVAEKAWYEERNPDEEPSRLIGVTTTSLYGSYSQYTRLVYWKELRSSEGDRSFEPTDDTYRRAEEYLRQEEPKKYWEWSLAKNENGLPLKTDAKQRSLTWLYVKLGIPKSLYRSGHKRGVYFCPFYENFKEYLTRQITDDTKLIRRKDFDNSVDALFELWRDKYAKPRILKMKDEHRYRDGNLFYDDLGVLTWEQTKNKWLKKVGKTIKDTLQ